MGFFNFGRKQELEKIDYDFQAINHSDFKCTFSFESKAQLMDKIYSKSVKKLRRTKGITTDKTPDDIEYFEVPDTMLRLIDTFVHDITKFITLQVLKDGIKVIRGNTIKCTYSKTKNKTWLVNVTLAGQYQER